jgi:hypothetical protein
MDYRKLFEMALQRVPFAIMMDFSFMRRFLSVNERLAVTGKN